MNNLTRRDFLKYAGLGTAGTAMLLALASCSTGEGNNTSGNLNESKNDNTSSQGVSGESGGNNINEGGDLDKDVEAAKQSAQVDIFRVHQGNNLTSVNPLTIKNASTGLYYSVYEMMFQNDNNMGGQMYPVLADSSKGSAGLGGYDHEPGSKDYTVYLYDNIMDSAGNHITAEDVKFCFQKTYEAGETSGWDSALPENIEVVDDYTLTWHCDRELDKLGELENIWCRCFIFSKKAFEASPSGFASDACGTGPYTLDSFTADSKAVLKKRNDHWQSEDKIQQIQMAHVDTIEYVQLSEAAQAVIALENATLDYSQDLKGEYVKDFLDGGSFSDKFDVYSYLSNMCATFMLNCDEASPCHDENLRNAIYWAVDNAAICAMLGSDSYSPVPFIATSYFSDYDPEWENLENYNTKTDLAKAKEYLDASGYDGRKLHMICNNGQTTLAEIIMNMIGEIGIQMDIEGLDRATLGTVQSDPSKWDMMVNITAGDFMPTLWSHNHDFSNTSTGDHSPFYVYDRKWQDMLEETATVSGHTKEKLMEYVKYTIEHAYGMGLYAQFNYCVYPANLKKLCFNDKLYIVPGGCVFE